MSTMTRAAEPLRPDFERREPRCRICRDETVRVLVNKLLDWHGAPIILGRGKTHLVTYADILHPGSPVGRYRGILVVTLGVDPEAVIGDPVPLVTALVQR